MIIFVIKLINSKMFLFLIEVECDEASKQGTTC